MKKFIVLALMGCSFFGFSTESDFVAEKQNLTFEVQNTYKITDFEAVKLTSTVLDTDSRITEDSKAAEMLLFESKILILEKFYLDEFDSEKYNLYSKNKVFNKRKLGQKYSNKKIPIQSYKSKIRQEILVS